MSKTLFPPVSMSRAAPILAAACAMDPELAFNRFQRFVLAGVIDSCGREGIGPKAAHVFDHGAVAAVAVMFEVFDRARITDAARLRKLFDYLAAPNPEGRLIDLVLSDVASGGQPVLWLTQFRGPDDGEQTVFSTRLSDELDRPIIAPGDDWEARYYGRIDLAPLLERFTGANVVRLKQASS